MKRLFSIILVALLVVTLMPIQTFATTDIRENSNVVYYEDGSYVIIELTYKETRASGTKTASKTYKYYNSDDVEQWRAVLSGTFSYTGSSATCTASSCNVTISNSAWYVVSKSATKSANVAIGEVTIGRKFLGITVDKESATIRITCDANGNLS